MQKILDAMIRLDDWLCTHGLQVRGISPVIVIQFFVPVYVFLSACFIPILKILPPGSVVDWLLHHSQQLEIVLVVLFGFYVLLLPFSFIGFHLIPPKSALRAYVRALVYLAYGLMWLFWMYMYGVFEFINHFSFSVLVEDVGSVLAATLIVLSVVILGGVMSAAFAAVTYGAAFYWDLLKFFGHETALRPPFLQNEDTISQAEWSSITVIAYIAVFVVGVHAMLQSESPEFPPKLPMEE